MFNEHEDCPIRDNEGREPTREDCGQCDRMKDSNTGAYYRSFELYNQLMEFAKTPQGAELNDLLKSEQFNDLLVSVRAMCMFLDSQLTALRMAGLELNLVMPMANIFAFGYMMGKSGDLPELTFKGDADGNELAGEIENYLKGLDDGDTSGTD